MAEGMQSMGYDPYLSRSAWSEDQVEPWTEEGQGTQSLGAHLLEFARENPASAALWCFGIGFVLGWRLKPW
jgi:hypothetical protein